MTRQLYQTHLRPIHSDDLGFLRQLYGTTRYDLARVAWDDQAKAAFLDQQFTAQHQHYQKHYLGASFDVILADQQAVGRLYVYQSPKEIRLMDIALLPEWRYRGIGGFYLQQLQAQAVANQQQLTLHVEPDNPAKAWYERLGFQLLEERGAYLFMGYNLASNAQNNAS
jgi:ribosomal protein S18 acetylase RimI-like enzyme